MIPLRPYQTQAIEGVREGARFGRLTVIAKAQSRNGAVWLCRCDCGTEKEVKAGNLRQNTRSCGCMAREMSAERRRAAAAPPARCRIEGCSNDTSKGGGGMCGKHAQRVRRHGDPHHLTPEETRRANNRAAQLARCPDAKPHTYRKLHGRHEHRVVGEAIAGRPLAPWEHVHHKDGNKHNNAPENLQVMHARDHAALHAREKRGDQ